MTTLAWASLRRRAAAFTATFVSVLLGTALIGSFATLIETATGPVSSQDHDNLLIMGAVVGSWGTAIVLFSLASTIGITVRQRGVEIGLLRTIGSSPRQARRLVRVETLLVSAVAAAGGAVLAAVGGRLLFTALRDGGVVASTVEFGGGPASLGATALAMVATALAAASVAGRRATRGPARLALAEAAADRPRLPWWRFVIALVLLGYGAAMAVVTITVTAHSDDPYDAMATSGNSGILVSLGLAALAPVLVRWTAALAQPAAGRASTSWQLALANARRRSHLLGGVLAPVIVFTAASVGTLMLVSIDHRSLEVPDDGTEIINLLNNVVVAMISLFAAIMVLNAWAATVAHRRTELARLWLLGATPTQVRGSVVAEATFVAVIGVALGFIASLVTVVPFAVARDEGIVPDGQLWLAPALMAAAVAITLGAAAVAVRRVTVRPAAILAGAAQ